MTSSLTLWEISLRTSSPLHGRLSFNPAMLEPGEFIIPAPLPRGRLSFNPSLILWEPLSNPSPASWGNSKPLPHFAGRHSQNSPPKLRFGGRSSFQPLPRFERRHSQTPSPKAFLCGRIDFPTLPRIALLCGRIVLQTPPPLCGGGLRRGQKE